VQHRLPTEGSERHGGVGGRPTRGHELLPRGQLLVATGQVVQDVHHVQRGEPDE
jgi:hypothetical protein